MSFGNKVGRALGTVGALVVEGSVRGATSLGQFGADVVEGTEQGYAEKHAALLLSRAAAEERRKAFMKAKQAEHAAALKVTAEPALATARKAKA